MRFTVFLGTAAVLVAGLAVPQAPAIAQAQKGVAEIVVFGTDPCPRSTDDQIVVCRRESESMRYRMPEAYRPQGTPQERESWAARSKSLQSLGRTGIGSCSAVGPAGYTGCLMQQIQTAKGERKQQAQDETPPQ
jgi:hypothetical protein